MARLRPVAAWLCHAYRYLMGKVRQKLVCVVLKSLCCAAKLWRSVPENGDVRSYCEAT
jgi:hypothetical protein